MVELLCKVGQEQGVEVLDFAIDLDQGAPFEDCFGSAFGDEPPLTIDVHDHRHNAAREVERNLVDFRDVGGGDGSVRQQRLVEKVFQPRLVVGVVVSKLKDSL